jgi:hypothetical protein
VHLLDQPPALFAPNVLWRVLRPGAAVPRTGQRVLPAAAMQSPR